MRHDRVQIVLVETVEHLPERLDFAFAGHETSTSGTAAGTPVSVIRVVTAGAALWHYCRTARR